MIWDDRPSGFLMAGRHHHELERGAVRALGNGDARLAHHLADRRCRISPLPNSQVYLLRAEAFHRLGDTAAALADVAKAIEINPDDVAATRRLMSWGDRDQQHDAAVAILSHDRDHAALRAALAVLRKEGRTSFARIDAFDDEITGWVAWIPGGDIEINLISDTETYGRQLAPDPKHPLATGQGHAANFRIARPSSAAHQFLRISQGETIVATALFPGHRPMAAQPRRLKPSRASGHGQTDPRVTVVVPVFADYPATKACLESLLTAADATKNLHLLIVDDASPDLDIKRHLATLARRPDVTILTNERNLGFVGAVNRGLEAATTGDVILLNADTLVPPGALGRLRDVVAATPGIGTATPLSNNGEFTSFPIRNKSNPLPDLDRIEALDRLAAVANDGIVVDIPNGIGFCLYLTRACLDAVGLLSDDFHRGYLEDVDLCLRAAEAGFRNVCIPSVFVGHEGSRSFRQDKRSLVVRNLRVLEHRYPRYHTECAAFLQADPLLSARGRLELALLDADVPDISCLIFCGPGASADVAMTRAQRPSAADTPALVARCTSDGTHCQVALLHPEGRAPQSLQFDMASPTDVDRLLDLLATLAPRVIEVAGRDQIPTEALELLDAQDFAAKILKINDELPADSPAAATTGARGPLTKRVNVSATHDLRFSSSNAEITRLGVIALRTSTAEFEAIRAMALRFLQDRPDLDIIVIGATIDDLRLMQIPNVYVTGPVAPTDITGLLNAYAIDRLITGLGDTMPGHPINIAASAAAIPTARFRGSSVLTTKADLDIPPVTTNEDLARMIETWLAA